MAKLTRTQKYADLRSDLANNRETNVASQDLSGYADRFNNVQETLEPERAPRPAAPEYSWQDRPVNNYQQAQEPTYNYQNNYQQAQEPSYGSQYNYQQPEQKPVSNAQNSYFESFMNAPKQENRETFNSYFEQENNNYAANDNTYRNVFNDVNDRTDDSISRKERDTYLNQTFRDVDFHNIANGEKTISQIVDNTVNEVRHNEAPRPAFNFEQEAFVDDSYDFNQAPVENAMLDADALNGISDDEYSNTVSMEINKIMDEMAVPNQTRQAAPQTVVQQQAAPQQAQQAPVNNVIMQEEPEEVVEIKNIDEIKDEPLRNTISGTIPFVVSSEDEEDIEDDENEGSNTILNIILIVLIVVLMAVLGLIVFYILKTKGIF